MYMKKLVYWYKKKLIGGMIMGLFNRKKGKNENETKQSRTSGIFPYSLSLSNGNKIMIL